MNDSQRLAVLIERLDEVQCDVKRCVRLLEGNNGSPGLRMKVDRLEQREKTRGRALWVVFGTALASLGAVLGKTLAGD